VARVTRLEEQSRRDNHNLRLAEAHGLWRADHPLSAKNQILPLGVQRKRLQEAQARIDAVVASGGSAIETMGYNSPLNIIIRKDAQSMMGSVPGDLPE
jgi:hypothetical protein